MNTNKLKLSLLSIFLLLAGSLIIKSCKKESSIEKTSEKTALQAENYFVKEQEACVFAEELSFPNELQSIKSEMNNSVKVVKKVKDITAIPDVNKLIAYYVINYENGGFAILSADKRFIPLLAFSDNSSLNIGSANFPPALASCLSSLKENIEFVRKNNVAATKEIQQVWKKFSNSNSDYNILKSISPIDPPPACTDQYEQVGPLLSTTWGQGCGYNDLLPGYSSNGCVLPCWRILAGCVPIAMAQVMKFHQHPTSYNWSSMPNSSSSSATAGLIKAIHDVIDITYDCNGTSASMSSAASALTNQFGYTSAILASYNSSTVESNLRSTRPVILGGGEHCWVCDGFLKSTFCWYDDSGTGQGAYIGTISITHLHMNWGHEQDGDGWFAIDNFNPTFYGLGTQNYNSNKMMIYNIIPQ